MFTGVAAAAVRTALPLGAAGRLEIGKGRSVLLDWGRFGQWVVIPTGMRGRELHPLVRLFEFVSCYIGFTC